MKKLTPHLVSVFSVFSLIEDFILGTVIMKYRIHLTTLRWRTCEHVLPQGWVAGERNQANPAIDTVDSREMSIVCRALYANVAGGTQSFCNRN